MDLLDHIDRDTTGKYDVTPLYADAEAFAALRTRLSAAVPEVTPVAGIEATGGQARGACRLLERAGAAVVGIAAVHADREGVDDLFDRYGVTTV